MTKQHESATANGMEQAPVDHESNIPDETIQAIEGETFPKLAITLNCLSIGCGLWFCFYGIVWVYFIALFAAYPVGLVGWLLYTQAKRVGGPTRLNLWARRIHQVGLVASLVMAFLAGGLPLIGTLFNS